MKRSEFLLLLAAIIAGFMLPYIVPVDKAPEFILAIGKRPPFVQAPPQIPSAPKPQAELVLNKVEQERGLSRLESTGPLPLSPAAKIGQGLFSENCEICHGDDAAGTESGPPLMHKMYRPDNRPDSAFYRAVEFGVMSRNWKFGDMPALKDIHKNQVKMIVQYVREMQKAKGIY